MELQWPLIIFTSLLAWCAGLFATQSLLAFKHEAQKSQMTAWIVSAALLVVGGIAVFLHLQHWERIFNGFGHVTSGITQELAAIVVLAVIALIYVVYLRKDSGNVPAWLCVLAIAFSAALIIAMGHSYLMPSRPAWNSIFEIGSLFGAAFVLGPLTMAVICATKEENSDFLSSCALIGSTVNGVLVALYLIAMQMSAPAFDSYDTLYFDPTHPNIAPIDVSAATQVLTGASAPLTWILVVAVGIAAPIACAFLGKKKGNWKRYGSVGTACALVGVIALRVVFYQAGSLVFGIY